MSNKKGGYKPRLTIDESKQVLNLYLSGKHRDEISKLVGRSPSVIRNIIKRAPEFGVEFPSNLELPFTYDRKDFEEQDFSSLPDNVLFKHSKEYIL